MQRLPYDLDCPSRAVRCLHCTVLCGVPIVCVWVVQCGACTALRRAVRFGLSIFARKNIPSCVCGSDQRRCTMEDNVGDPSTSSLVDRRKDGEVCSQWHAAAEDLLAGSSQHGSLFASFQIRRNLLAPWQEGESGNWATTWGVFLRGRAIIIVGRWHWAFQVEEPVVVA